jgi:hypothetical protein
MTRRLTWGIYKGACPLVTTPLIFAPGDKLQSE